MKLPIVHFFILRCLLMATVFCSGTTLAYDQKTATVQVSIVGEYYRGDGLGQNDGLNLKSDKTFFFSQSSDDGQSAKWSGTYTLQNNRVTLTPSYAPLSLYKGKFHDLSMCWNHATPLFARFEPTPSFPLKTLVAVPWGKRLYLILDEDMRHFCNDINLGEEPRGDIHGDYFARLGNTQRMELDAAIGKPTLPAPWNTFLLATPVQAPITAVVHTGRKGKSRTGEAAGEIIALTIRAGSRQGLKLGMLLFMHGTPEFTKKYLDGDEYAIIRSVKSNECVAEFTTYVPDLPVKVGMTASTRLDKSTVEYYQHPPKPQTGGGG